MCMPAAIDWRQRRIISYAHQGGSYEGPSSTISAIRSALKQGATGIELDVHSTLDGHLVVCHDPEVDRTTNGSGKIASMTWEEISKLDNAYWFVPGREITRDLPEDAYILRGRAGTDPDFRIARLDEVIELMQDYPGVVVNLDIKQTYPEVDPYEEKLADLIHRNAFEERTIVASFLDSALERFHAYAPEIFTAAGPSFVSDFVRALQAGQHPDVHIDLNQVSFQVPTGFSTPTFSITIVDANFIETARNYGLAVHVWTINDAAEMERLIDLGVDGIITDRPTILVDILNSRGMTWRL